jgi:hypothetical protein
MRAENHIRLASDLGLGSTRYADIGLIGTMPSGRRLFSVLGATEPDTFARAEQGRREVCRLAQGYFDQRDRYARQYSGETVLLGHDRVLLHAPIGEITVQRLFQTIGAEGLGGNEVFLKRVQEEEAELRAPYTL